MRTRAWHDFIKDAVAVQAGRERMIVHNVLHNVRLRSLSA